MRRFRWFIGLVLAFILLLPGLVWAEEAEKAVDVPYAPSLWDALLPQGDEKVGDIPVEYNRYPMHHYRLDLWIKERSFWDLVTDPVEETKGWVTDEFAFALHGLVDTFWRMNVGFSRIVVWVLEESLKFDLVGELIEGVAEGVRNLAGYDGNLGNRGFYGLMLPLLIVLFAGYVGYKAMEENDEMTVISAVLSFLLVVMGGLVYFHYVEDIAGELNRFGSELGKGLLALTTATFQPTERLTSEEAVAQAGNNLWEVTVRMPYKLLEFGTLQVDEKRVERVLSTPPEERSGVLEEEKRAGNRMILPESVWDRLWGAFLFFVGNLFVWVIPLFIAVLRVVYQGWFLVLLLLGPIALAWAVVPSWRETLYRWAGQVLHAVLMQAALSMMLAIYLALGGALFAFGEEKGYLVLMLLQVVLVITLIKQRRVLFALVTAPAMHLMDRTDRMPRFMRHFPRWWEKALMARSMARNLKHVRSFFRGGLEPKTAGASSGEFHVSGEEPEPVELKEMPKATEETFFEFFDDPQIPGTDRPAVEGKEAEEVELPLLPPLDPVPVKEEET